MLFRGVEITDAPDHSGRGVGGWTLLDPEEPELCRAIHDASDLR
jgi:hypothetical protein